MPPARPAPKAAAPAPAADARDLARRLAQAEEAVARLTVERDEARRRLDESVALIAALETAVAPGAGPSEVAPAPITPPVPPAEETGPGMKRFQSAESQRRFAREMRDAGKRIGFVPTMGAFHRGHLSLIEKARAQNDVVVVSIFVNPLQFGPGEDYERYPRDLARDIDQCRAAGVDAVFQPDVTEIYPPGFTTRVSAGPLGERLCGAFRPGHFDGVCTVVAKLIGIVAPHRLYLGEKDAQQLVILERMVRDLNMDVKITPCPTVREESGLAMSSRNGYLTAEERGQAAKIYEALRIAQREILVCHTRDPRELTELMREVIESGTSMQIDYIAMVDPETLEPRPVLEGRTLIAVRVRLGQTHLIDNLLINVPGGRMAMQFRTPGCEHGRPGGGPELKSRK